MNSWLAHEGAPGSQRCAVNQGALPRLGYRQINQEGSHIILQTETPAHQRMSVPNHNPLRVGTLNGILKAVANHKGVDRQALLDSLR